jgi:hypothetical protein
LSKNNDNIIILRGPDRRGSTVLLNSLYGLYDINKIVIYKNKVRILSAKECIIVSVEVPKLFTKDILLNKIKSEMIRCDLNPEANALLLPLFDECIDEIVLELNRLRKSRE